MFRRLATLAVALLWVAWLASPFVWVRFGTCGIDCAPQDENWADKIAGPFILLGLPVAALATVAFVLTGRGRRRGITGREQA